MTDVVPDGTEETRRLDGFYITLLHKADADVNINASLVPP